MKGVLRTIRLDRGGKRSRAGPDYFHGDLVAHQTRRARILDRQRSGAGYEDWEKKRKAAKQKPKPVSRAGKRYHHGDLVRGTTKRARILDRARVGDAPSYQEPWEGRGKRQPKLQRVRKLRAINLEANIRKKERELLKLLA